MRLAIIGGGAAGTSAAWAARRANADVTVLFDRPGATALSSGALDLAPWEQARPDEPIAPDVMAFAAALEAWTLGTQACRVATHAGVLRTARGIDAALLDLAPLAGSVVAVADASIGDWDGASIARSLGASAWSQRTRTRFEAVPVAGIVDAGEVGASVFDVALLHDREERLARLASCLGAQRSPVDAWLLGPWLGTAPGAAERLRALVGRPCGETTSPPGGPAGARFEASRDALFAGAGIHVRRERVVSLELRADRWHAQGPVTGGLTAKDTGYDAVILAFGGVAAGGISLGESGFSASVTGPLVLGLDGRALDPGSTLHGVDFAARGFDALERVGLLVDGGALRGAAARGLFAAGDCAADRSRTVIEAVRSGIAAARATAQ